MRTVLLLIMFALEDIAKAIHGSSLVPDGLVNVFVVLLVTYMVMDVLEFFKKME